MHLLGSSWLYPRFAVGLRRTPAKTLITTSSQDYDAVGRHADLGAPTEREALGLLATRRQPR